MESHEYLLRHSQELSEEYRGKYIVVVSDMVVAASRSAMVVFKDAKKKFPKEEIAIFYMPTDEETVPLLFERFKICFEEKEKGVEFI